MAIHTPKNYRNQVLYSVFVRNHSQEGTFEALRQDLDRIRRLGVDIIWLMPIHPLGEKSRKGSVGSPYAVKDYRKIDPALGTEEDLRRLVRDIHDRGMKCILDVVYNHTAPDSWLAEHHPEWFYHKPDGSFGNRVGDWYDIIDLDYSHPGLWEYQIDTLRYWAQLVDGFRCDAAPLVPLAFWQKARQAVEQVRPGCFWLGETVEPHFIVKLRSLGMTAHSDGEAFQVFDACYDYDIYDIFRNYCKGEASLADYARAVNQQESLFPENYVKLRCLENHDRPRAKMVVGEKALEHWTAFLYFQKGMTMLFGGQEVGAGHLPRLFEKDPVDWTGKPDLSALMAKLYAIKQDKLFTDSAYHVTALPGDVLLATHEKDGQKLYGIFSARGESALVPIDLPNGTYENLLGGAVDVYEGCLRLAAGPILLKV